jgi:hypothetical protein
MTKPQYRYWAHLPNLHGERTEIACKVRRGLPGFLPIATASGPAKSTCLAGQTMRLTKMDRDSIKGFCRCQES